MTTHWIQKVHLLFVAISLCAVVLSFLFSTMYLLQQWQLKHKKNLPAGQRLPSLETLDHYVIRSLVVGAVSLSVLLVTGIFLAHQVWRKDWTQDEKFIVAMCTWIWFLLTLVLRFRFGVRGGKFFYSIFFGFVLLVASCFLAWMV